MKGSDNYGVYIAYREWVTKKGRRVLSKLKHMSFATYDEYEEYVAIHPIVVLGIAY